MTITFRKEMEDSRRIHKFYGKPHEDFQLWQVRTEAALQSKELLYVMEADAVGANYPSTLSAESQLAIAQARAIIVQGLGDRPLRVCISEKTNHYKMWRPLKEIYAVVNVATRVQLQSRLSRVRYTKQEMPQYIDTFEEIFNRLASMDCKITEDLQVAMLLASFGDKNKSPYGQVVARLQTVTEILTWESASARLLQEFEEKEFEGHVGRTASYSRNGMNEKDLALVVGNKKWGTHRKGFKPKGTRIETRTCFERAQVGHIARNCPQKKCQALQAEQIELSEGQRLRSAHDEFSDTSCSACTCRKVI